MFCSSSYGNNVVSPLVFEAKLILAEDRQITLSLLFHFYFLQKTLSNQRSETSTNCRQFAILCIQHRNGKWRKLVWVPRETFTRWIRFHISVEWSTEIVIKAVTKTLTFTSYFGKAYYLSTIYVIGTGNFCCNLSLLGTCDRIIWQAALSACLYLLRRKKLLIVIVGELYSDIRVHILQKYFFFILKGISM